MPIIVGVHTSTQAAESTGPDDFMHHYRRPRNFELLNTAERRAMKYGEGASKAIFLPPIIITRRHSSNAGHDGRCRQARPC